MVTTRYLAKLFKLETKYINRVVKRNIRKFIESQGGTMPEDLPTPEKSLKQIEKKEKNKLIKK